MATVFKELSHTLHHRLRRPLGVIPRSNVTAQALPLRQGGVARTPRDVLGVTEDADAVSIKTAFRRLALKYHPDRQGDETHFMEILKAYEILIGKAEGKDPMFDTDWEFHDWYWKFTMNRKRGTVQVTSARFQADLPSQLAGLRERAAIRRTKASAVRSASFTEMPVSRSESHDCEERPADSGPTSEGVTSEARYAEEARRRADLNSEKTKANIRHQLTGLRRRSQIRNVM